jgi:hypothetical protein
MKTAVCEVCEGRVACSSDGSNTNQSSESICSRPWNRYLYRGTYTGTSSRGTRCARYDTHDTHDLQGALCFRVPQQKLSIQAPKTCYARSTLVEKTVTHELGTCNARACKCVANEPHLQFRYATSFPCQQFTL